MPLPQPKALLYVRPMTDRLRAMTGLTAWIVFVAASITGLHSLHSALPVNAIWSSVVSLELALGAMARVIGLVSGYWLLASTLVYLMFRAAQAPAIRKVDWATLPMVRRLADRISTRSLVRVLAAPLPLLDLVTPGYVPIPPDSTQSQTAVSEAPVAETPIVATQRAEAIEVTILAGDNMWTLAESRLHEVMGRPPTDAETGPYWRRVVQANRNRIISGDPDLIFPGEVLILPPV
jgi:hypothetical protein